MILIKNLEKQERRKLNNKLIRIDGAFIVKITIMKDITLRNISCNKSSVAFVRLMIIIRINAPKKKNMGHAEICMSLVEFLLFTTIPCATMFD
jgi:ribosome biogenesis SPOUT family RNA methylase Rps3